MLYRVLPQFLTQRERVVVCALAKGPGFEEGRQHTGYLKRNLLEVDGAQRLIKRALSALGDPLLYDAWLLKYPVGAAIPLHVDPPIEGMCHVRINAMALASVGGLLYLDGEEIPLGDGDAYVFRPDVVKHQVTEVQKHERLVFSVGANVDTEHARRLQLL